tara:strand:+ start:720 stop:1205 length:486 start_codon:yes stop_codon:yes gene_type:complete
LALYECVFIARQDISNTALNTTIDRFKKIIDDNKSKVHDTEIWGLRSLSYKIKKNRKGNFVMMKIEGSGVAISELERNFRIEEDIIRYLTIKVKKFNEEPSIMMQTKDKDNNGLVGKVTDNDETLNTETKNVKKDENIDPKEQIPDTKEHKTTKEQKEEDV